MNRFEKINQDFSTLYRDGEKWLRESSGEVINSHREDAFRQFISLGGIPQQTENYRYADLLPVFDRDYNVVLKNTNHEVDPEELFTCYVPELNTNQLLVVNGWLVSSEKTMDLPEGVIVCSLAEAGVKYKDILEKHYNKYTTPGESDSLIALNTAFAQDGVFVYVPAGVVLEKPLQIVNLLRADRDLLSFQRNLVVLEKGAQITLLECDHTLSDHTFLSANTTEVVLGENAYMDFYQVQNQHIAASQINSLFVRQERNSHVDANIISLYGGFIRNNVYVSLAGEGAGCNLYGMYLSDKKQQVDNFTSIDHIAPNCYSNEHFKGVLDDAAIANFSGRIVVRPGAQKTEAYQANNNLLLTNTAQVNTKPQLVIDADDVKCTHGATVGQMDEDAMFYLRSRGIGAAEARLMMMFGFAHEIVGRIRLEPLQAQIDDMVEKRLRGELTKCHNCILHCNR